MRIPARSAAPLLMHELSVDPKYCWRRIYSDLLRDLIFRPGYKAISKRFVRSATLIESQVLHWMPILLSSIVPLRESDGMTGIEEVRVGIWAPRDGIVPCYQRVD